jgi:hypothetical protein
MTSGRTFDIQHPEMIRVLRSSVLIFSYASEDPVFPDEFHNVSLMLAESVSHLEPSVA